MSVEIAQKFIDAILAKDLDAAVDQMTEDAELETPMMGTKSGKKQIKGTLSMILKMGGGNLAAAEEKNGHVMTTTSGPMGRMLLGFTFKGDRIRSITVQRG